MTAGALAHAIRAFQRGNALVAVCLLLLRLPIDSPCPVVQIVPQKPNIIIISIPISRREVKFSILLPPKRR